MIFNWENKLGSFVQMKADILSCFPQGGLFYRRLRRHMMRLLDCVWRHSLHECVFSFSANAYRQPVALVYVSQRSYEKIKNKTFLRQKLLNNSVTFKKNKLWSSASMTWYSPKTLPLSLSSFFFYDGPLHCKWWRALFLSLFINCHDYFTST